MEITSSLEPGTKVRYTELRVSRMDERGKKRFNGQVGVITGYRAQSSELPEPIVTFPKFGRFKEEKIFEVPWKDIELAE
ncbi:hypothetical protein [Pseudomonas putida]|uniref:Uncharacterized protein n=1 Tax=Pseudomonas putida TaxID=303 RepID=A0A8I1EC15_PSEPU|nr:hypothetical protein [Pseudomonas putida]MBI6883025.1 hypothetical protein [Pseudomonas putida]